MFKIGDEVVLNDRNGIVNFKGDAARVFKQKRTGKILSIMGTALREKDRSYFVKFPAMDKRQKDIILYLDYLYIKY